MVRRWLYCLMVLVALLATGSCAVSPSDFAIESVEILDGVESDTIRVEVVLRNDSQRDIMVRDARISTQIKGDDLVSFELVGGIELRAEDVTRGVTRWSVRRDDPATLYSMRRYSIDRYIGRMTFGYEVSVEGVSRRTRRFGRRGLRAEELDINFEKLLR